MKKTIIIERGKLGFFLVVNGYAIKRDFTGDIIATKTESANNWIASEWNSITSLRDFWKRYMLIILHKSKSL